MEGSQYAYTSNYHKYPHVVKIIPYSNKVVDFPSSTLNFRCGILQEGDRVLAINGTNVMGYSLAECKQMLHHTGAKCLLEVAFDVAGTVTRIMD